MPSTYTIGQANESSFLGLQSYTEAQSNLFFGRNTEIDTLTTLVGLNTLTIIFDQFEEIFTLAKANPRFASVELPLFWEELSNVIENNIPEKLKEEFLHQKEKVEFNYKKQKAKVVFSFREEYLPEFETIASR